MAIAAIATAFGTAAIGIVRVSGSDAISISNSITDIDLSSVKPRTAYLGNIDNGFIIDHALIIVFNAPHSYTGENMVEFHCHGNPIILQNVLDALLQHGCTLAERGEFTKQAFLNGKLSINQAQSVLDLIQAKSTNALKLANFNLDNDFNTFIADNLTNIIAHIHAVTDFQLEDFNPNPQISIIINTIQRAIDSSNYHKNLRDGFKVAIIGKPNVGKSTLLNRLANCERAIVSDIPGTTRDTVTFNTELAGVPVTFTDTAGITQK